MEEKLSGQSQKKKISQERVRNKEGNNVDSNLPILAASKSGVMPTKFLLSIGKLTTRKYPTRVAIMSIDPALTAYIRGVLPGMDMVKCRSRSNKYQETRLRFKIQLIYRLCT